MVQEEVLEHVKITPDDVALLGSARDKSRNNIRFSDLSQDERDAHQRIHSALEILADLTARQLGYPAEVEIRLTSGFHPRAGVRGYVPKDLWFAVYPANNADKLAGNPQLFMIVSERGLEYGFGAAVHPRDFSTPALQAKVRETAPTVFERLPRANSAETDSIGRTIELDGDWHFLDKHRLSPAQARFSDLRQWLAFLQSPEGHRNAAGSISRFILPQDLQSVDLKDAVVQMADLFRPLILRDWSDQTEEVNLREATVPLAPSSAAPEFAQLLRSFFAQFDKDRRGPFRMDTSLRAAMADIRTWLEKSAPVQKRPTIEVKLSVGQGSWTRTPWIALLDNRVTNSTQRGIYLVFLIAEDLSITFLTLNQGMTDLVKELGQKGAVDRMRQVAVEARPAISAVAQGQFTLNSDIDLRSNTTAASNYEVGTIMHWAMPSGNLPDNETVIARLETALRAYEQVLDLPANEDQPATEEPPTVLAEPFTIDDALADLFMSREVFEKYLSTWRSKKNLILQGAPGVGKSFVAKKLAYALIGAKDRDRVETVQFHQSYSYEDFVQGYRPNGSGTFELQNGTFHRFRDQAMSSPTTAHVLVIDEINRGNLSKIFGELMLLIEPDKRSIDWATRLAYAKPGDGKFHVPDNLYIIGMMNTADRSLSLVDYALRRRFAFMSVEPMFSQPKFGQVLASRGIPEPLIAAIRARMSELNEAIGLDVTNLGPGYRIGHSFFTPAQSVAEPIDWYRTVVETEIYPLLEEYWFDNPTQAQQWQERLLEPVL